MCKLFRALPLRQCSSFKRTAIQPVFLLSALLHTMSGPKDKQCSLKGNQNYPSNLKMCMAEWEFSASSISENNLPIDCEPEPSIRSNVKGAFFSRVQPSPLEKNVKLVAVSTDVLVNILNMHPSIAETDEFVEWISGSNVLDSSTPLAHRYGGYQFGTWAGQLGDGRAMSLGEYVSCDGKRWDIQLKGSGLTPYSRQGDGRAVLRSSVREFLCSEAMLALGIPTSRAAALVVSSDPVIRDPFYDGRIQVERAAIVMRIAPSFLRFGSLEILTQGSEMVELKKMVDYVLKLRTDITDYGESKHIALLEQIINETTKLAILWATVGFTHGVLNTDNMSLFGITIDYGPFGFMEKFDRNFIPNTSDGGGRYSYFEQFEVVQWNLAKLVLAMKPLMSESEQRRAESIVQNALSSGENLFLIAFYEKLGFTPSAKSNLHLVEFLLLLMEETGADFTMTFRQLAFVKIDEMFDPSILEKNWALDTVRKHAKFEEFVELYKHCMTVEGLSDEERRSNMLARNPQYVLRNWMAQQAIKQAEQDDFSGVQFLLEVLSKPFTINDEAEKLGFSGPTPQWASRIRVSCSS